MLLGVRTGTLFQPLPYLRRVSYLESHGTEYIDTRIAHSTFDQTEMKISLAPVEYLDNWQKGFCGPVEGHSQYSIAGSSSNNFACWVNTEVKGTTPATHQDLLVKKNLTLSTSLTSSGMVHYVFRSDEGSVESTRYNSVSGKNFLVFNGAFGRAKAKMRLFLLSFKRRQNT